MRYMDGTPVQNCLQKLSFLASKVSSFFLFLYTLHLLLAEVVGEPQLEVVAFHPVNTFLLGLKSYIKSFIICFLFKLQFTWRQAASAGSPQAPQ